MSKENLHFDNQNYNVSFFATLFSKINRKHVLHVSIELIRNTNVKVWKNLKKLWKHLPAACIATAVLVLPNFHLCFYNLIETWFLFVITGI